MELKLEASWYNFCIKQVKCLKCLESPDETCSLIFKEQLPSPGSHWFGNEEAEYLSRFCETFWLNGSVDLGLFSHMGDERLASLMNFLALKILSL